MIASARVSTKTIPRRTWLTGTSIAKAADWVARTNRQGARFLLIEVTTTGLKLPFSKVPKFNVIPSVMIPWLTNPPTTVPTQGTSKISSTWNSGLDCSNFSCSFKPATGGKRCKNLLTSFSPDPETELTQKMGTTFSLGVLLTALRRSSLFFTTNGTFLEPTLAKNFFRLSKVACNLGLGVISTFVIMIKNGTSKAMAYPVRQ